MLWEQTSQKTAVGVVKVSAVVKFLESSKTCTESQWNEEKRISVGDFLFSKYIPVVGNCVIVKDVREKLML